MLLKPVYTFSKGYRLFVSNRFTNLMMGKLLCVFQEYNVTLVVNDGKYSNQTTVQITIIDTNDNTPKFDQNTYVVRNLIEETVYNKILITVGRGKIYIALAISQEIKVSNYLVRCLK